MTNLLSAAGFLLLVLPDQPKYWENILPIRRCPISHCFFNFECYFISLTLIYSNNRLSLAVVCPSVPCKNCSLIYSYWFGQGYSIVFVPNFCCYLNNEIKKLIKSNLYITTTLGT